MKLYLSGYYPPSLDAFKTIEEWEDKWTIRTLAKDGWVLFTAGYYTIAEVKERLKKPGSGQIYKKAKTAEEKSEEK